MAFHDVLFPSLENWGGDGGPGFSTSVTRMDSGQERVVLRNNMPTWRFDPSFRIKRHGEITEIIKFYLMRNGAANSFRYDWPSDRDSTPEGESWSELGKKNPITPFDQVIQTGSLNRENIQLVKRYADPANSFVRPIELPVDGTVRVAIDDGVTQLELIEGPQFSVNYATGKVTLSPTVGLTLTTSVTAGFEYHQHVRFDEGIDVDALRSAARNYGVASIPSIPLVGVPFNGTVRDDVPGGGSKTIDIDAAGGDMDYSAKLWAVTPLVNTDLRLPDISGAPIGGPVFIIANQSPTQIINIRDFETGTLQQQVLAGRSAWVFCEGPPKSWILAQGS